MVGTEAAEAAVMIEVTRWTAHTEVGALVSEMEEAEVATTQKEMTAALEAAEDHAVVAEDVVTGMNPYREAPMGKWRI